MTSYPIARSGGGGGGDTSAIATIVSPAHINNEAIAGHNAAIDTLTKVIDDFMPLTSTSKLANDLVNQYVEDVPVLRKELQGMEEKTMKEKST